MYLYGSRALAEWFPENYRSNSDYDYIIEEEKLVSEYGKSFSRHSAKFLDGGKLLEFADIEFLNNRAICETYNERSVINPIGLMLIKRSHLHRPVGFAKHIRHYHFLKSRVTPDNEYFPLLSERTKLTKRYFKDRTPSLNMSNNDFFDDSVEKFFVHDDLHKVVAYYDKPVYEKMKYEGLEDKAFCEKDLWDKLSFEEQINCVREESFVIALERKIIPKLVRGQKHMPPHMAFEYALERVCTTLTGGWFRDFAIENWPSIRKYDRDYLKLFLEQKDKLTCLC